MNQPTPQGPTVKLSKTESFDVNPLIYIVASWQKFRQTNLVSAIVIGLLSIASFVSLLMYGGTILDKWYGQAIGKDNWQELATQIGAGVFAFILVQIILGIAVNRVILTGSQGVKLSASDILNQTLRRIPINIATVLTIFVLAAVAIGLIVASGVYIHPAVAVLLAILAFFGIFAVMFVLMPLRCILVDDNTPSNPFAAFKMSYSVIKRATVAFLVIGVLYFGVSSVTGNIQQFVPLPGSSSIVNIQESADKEEAPTKSEIKDLLKFMQYSAAISMIPSIALDYALMLGLSELYSRVKKAS